MILTPGQLIQRAEFYHQLGSLLTAGLPIIQALETLQRNPPDRSYRKPITTLLEGINRGLTVSEALGELGNWIPSFDQALLHAGEQSGRLDVCLKLLASYYRERAGLIRKIIGDLLYPAFVLHFAVFIFPFIEWFKTGNLTLFLLQTLGPLSLLYFAVFFLIFACQGRRGHQWRSIIEGLLHPIPILGNARRKLALARLATALEALISAGVPMIQAWSLAATASGSPALSRAVESWKESLQAGETPGELLAESPEFPELFANLYRSGEVSGQIDDTLRRLHALYQEDGSRKLHLVATWTPKAIYFAIVIFVGFKVISFYTGYFATVSEVMK